MLSQNERRPKSFWQVVVTAIVAMPLVAGEAVLRAVPEKPQGRYRTVEGDSIFIPDTLLGWTVRPGGRFVVRSPEYRVAVSLDSLGMRQPHGGEGCRVLVIGDSFVAGYAVEDDALFWRVAGDVSGCEVFGYGVEGYATDQEYLALQRLLPIIQPSRVVLAFYQNDVWCNAQPVCELIGKPRFSPVMGFTKPAPVRIQPRPVKVLPASDPPASGGVVLRIKQALNRHSHFYRLARSVAKGPTAVSSLSLSPVPEEFQVLRVPESPDVVQAWRITEALLLAMDSLAPDFTVLHVPLRENVYRDEWQAVVAKQRFDSTWAPDAVEQRLQSLCQSHTWSCIFPRDSLRQRRSYFYADPHWNAAGHRIVGRLLGSALRQH